MENSIDSKRLNIDLADYWMIIRKRSLSVIFIFVLVVFATYTYTKSLMPEYEAVTKIKLALRQPMATIQGAQITWYGSRGNEIPSEIKLIKNKTGILSNVLDVLKYGVKSNVYQKNIEFFTNDVSNQVKRDTGNKKKMIVKIAESINSNKELLNYVNTLSPASIGGMLDIEQIPDTNIVKLIVRNRYPEICIAVANALAIVYNIDYWQSKTTQAKDQLDFIDTQLKAELAKQEKNTIKIVKSTEKESFLGSADIYKQELTHMNIELQKLLEKYTDKHPRVVKLKHLIHNLEEQLAEIPRVSQEVHKNKQDNSISEDFIKTLEELKLKANIDYQAKQSKAQEEIQVIAWAVSAPQTKPNFSVNMTVGILFGIILGCLFAFIWEGLDTSIGKIEDVERITGLPVIAHIPIIGSKGGQKTYFRSLKVLLKMFMKILPFSGNKEVSDLEQKVLFKFDSMSVIAEAYRTLRTNIQFAMGTVKATGNIISITSSSPREGKTLTSTNLAISLAQMGKSTLLLEADMRCPRVASLFQIDEKPGLSDVLIGTTKLDSAIRTITDLLVGEAEWDQLMEVQGLDNLNILPCGTLPPNPTELLTSPEFPTLIQQLRDRYEFIIVDTPPSLPVADSSIVSTVVDGTLMVYQSDTTSRHFLLRAIQLLQKNKAKLLGVVINQLAFDVVINSKSQYGDGYNTYSDYHSS